MLAHPAFRRWLDGALGALEAPLVERVAAAPRRPPLFVLGAPRSGTTALYLTLVNHLRFAFFPNLAKRHPRAPLSYTLLGALGRGGYRPTFENRFGCLAAPMAPSDGWHLFTRWLPGGACDAAAAEGAEPLRTLVRAFELLYRAPFCVRNNVNSLRIPALRRLFPEALFVAIRRDWRETALSLAEAYRVHGTPRGAWWSAGPPDVDPAGFEDVLEKAVFQVLGVEALLHRDLEALPGASRVLVDYEALCRRPADVVRRVRALYAHRGIPLRARGGAPEGEVRRSARGRRIDPALRARLEGYRQAFVRGEHLAAETQLSPELRARVGGDAEAA